jgi:DNA ligase D-like protein (predicted 3'-phosphoesterase)
MRCGTMAKINVIGLDTYRKKRNFSVTAEPNAVVKSQATSNKLFVVQKHAAHRAGLHWDFRLEHDGVLWSWAVPKGPLTRSGPPPNRDTRRRSSN